MIALKSKTTWRTGRRNKIVLGANTIVARVINVTRFSLTITNVTEPVYEFVRGKGWVVKTTPQRYRYNDIELLGMKHSEKCANCGHRLGLHTAGIFLECPGRAGYYARP